MTACQVAIATALLHTTLPAAAATTPAPTYALTIYQSQDAEPLFDGAVDFEPPPGYALVNERRSVEIGEGRGTLSLKGFPRTLVADALAILLAHGQVLSQRFESEPVRSERLLERSLGRQVTIEQPTGSGTELLTGELLTAGLPIALRLENGAIVTVNDYSRITLASPPSVSATPQLRLAVDSERAGLQDVSMIYPATGLAWRAEYVARLFGGRDCRVNFFGQARIVNHSGHGFIGAEIKLIAGEPPVSAADIKGSDDESGAGLGDIIVPLQTALDLPDGSSQQVALMPEQRARRCTTGLTYVGQPLRADTGRVPITDPAYGRDSRRQVRSTISFETDQRSALPAGRLRVLREDGEDGTVESLGEHAFARSPGGARIEIGTGIDPDLTGERMVGDLQMDPAGLGLAETVSILLRSRGKTAKVRVREHLYRWTRWNISRNTQPFEKVGDDTIEFLIDVPPDGEASVSYRVRYRWSEDFR